MEAAWANANKVYHGAMKLSVDPGRVESGETFERAVVERVPFLRADQISETEMVSLESTYQWGVFNHTTEDWLNRPLKGVLVPGYTGPIPVCTWMEFSSLLRLLKWFPNLVSLA
jgi:hypothetical protein